MHNKQYTEYVIEHKRNIKKAWKILRRILPWDLLRDLDLSKIEELIELHDQSKFNLKEYVGYANYFYPPRPEDKDKKAFDLAWCIHQKTNPHHWQCWVLLKDNGEEVVLEMDKEYVIELICDWMTFGIKKGNLKEILNYWEEVKEDTLFHPNTRKYFKQVLKIIEQKL